MLYKYHAIKDGMQYDGEKEAPDKMTLYKEVRKEGGTIVSAEEKTEKVYFWKKMFSRGVKLDDKVTLAKNLAVMLDAGISVNRALSIIGKQASSKKLVSVMNSLSDSINRGDTLSGAMKNHPQVFSDLFVMMVHSGEESGKLSGALRLVAGQMERASSLNKKVKGAMIYPTVVIIVMIILGIVLLVYMVPTLTETFKGLGVELPLPTRIIVAISDFLRNNYLILGGFLLVGGLGLFSFLKTAKGKRMKDYFVLHLPLITPLVKQVNAARTARTLSSLISSSVNIISALEVTRDVLQNSYYKEALKDAGETIQKGETISSILMKATDLYPIYVGEMVAVGEETGELSTMLENVANFYEEEVDEKTKNLSTLIEPILMIFIGVAVGIFAVSMLLPTYSLVDVIQ
jgi:type IV pilus assembly protein PilC